jgi:hypothetical protein
MLKYNLLNRGVQWKYWKIETKIQPIVDLLETKKDAEYRGLYKGIVTLMSPLLESPDVLFLGINSGSGAWKERNGDGETNDTPLRMLNHDEQFIRETNDLFKSNTARGSWGTNKENKSFEWWQRDKPINNVFPARMIDLIYEIAHHKYPSIETQDTEEPKWSDKVKSKIMYTNLYPIITDDTRALKSVHKLLAEEDLMRTLIGKSEINEWDVRLFFINQIYRLIELINPKVIVCLGATVFNDFTFTSTEKKDPIFKTTIENRPVIGFSRRGNWSTVIPELAKHILHPSD